MQSMRSINGIKGKKTQQQQKQKSSHWWEGARPDRTVAAAKKQSKILAGKKQEQWERRAVPRVFIEIGMACWHGRHRPAWHHGGRRGMESFKVIALQLVEKAVQPAKRLCQTKRDNFRSNNFRVNQSVNQAIASEANEQFFRQRLNNNQSHRPKK